MLKYELFLFSWESTQLMLIAGMSNSEVLYTLEWEKLVSKNSEEFNKVLVLTIARAIHIAGNFLLKVHFLYFLRVIVSL